MSAASSKRGFSLLYLCLWMALISVACGTLWWSRELDSNWLFCFGSVCAGICFILAWIAWQRCWKYASLVVLLLISSYCGSYAWLSLHGQYEWSAAGLSGVKWYSWVPTGFADEEEWNMRMISFYYPLYRLDVSYWHPHVRPDYNGPLPINRA